MLKLLFLSAFLGVTSLTDRKFLKDHHYHDDPSDYGPGQFQTGGAHGPEDQPDDDDVDSFVQKGKHPRMRGDDPADYSPEQFLGGDDEPANTEDDDDDSFIQKKKAAHYHDDPADYSPYQFLGDDTEGNGNDEEDDDDSFVQRRARARRVVKHRRLSKLPGTPQDYRDDRETVIPPPSLRILKAEADEPDMDVFPERDADTLLVQRRKRHSKRRAAAKMAHHRYSDADYSDDRLTVTPYVPLRILEEEADEPGVNPLDHDEFTLVQRRKHGRKATVQHHRRHRAKTHTHTLTHSNNPEDYLDDRETVIPPLSLRVLRAEADEPGVDPLDYDQYSAQ